MPLQDPLPLRHRGVRPRRPRVARGQPRTLGQRLPLHLLGPGGMPSNGIVATYSIVAFDPETDSLGVAVQSKFLAVGSVVPWARAGVGAVATQAMANYNYGPQGLDLMSEGHTADETIEALLSADEDREHRQVGIVDGKGRAATFTGSECFDWAGRVTGDHFAGPGKHPCRRGDGLGHGERLQRGGGGPHRAAALGARCRAEGWRGLARQTVGGVARRAGGRGLRRDNDRVVDLRVDDHPEPI